MPCSLKKKSKAIYWLLLSLSQVITVPLKPLCVLTSTTPRKLPGLNSSLSSSLSSLWFYGFSMRTSHSASQPLTSVFLRLQSPFLHHPHICMTNPPYPWLAPMHLWHFPAHPFPQRTLHLLHFPLYFFSSPLRPTKTEAL